MVISQENRVLLESIDSTDSSNERLATRVAFDILIRRSVLKRAGSFIFLAHPWASAYYHWVIEVLPKLAQVENFPQLKNIPVIVPRQLTEFQADSLRMAGVAKERAICLDERDWTVEKLYYPGTLSPSGSPSPHAVAWLRETFLDRVSSPSSPASRRIYLTRRDAPQRRVLNEPEVIEFLQEKGFEIICPGDYSFAQQIDIFRQVSIVVAPHGAGLTNMVFAPRGATLIEFFGDNYVNGCYWAMASICGHQHAFMTARTQTLDYTVPVTRLRGLLERVSRHANQTLAMPQ